LAVSGIKFMFDPTKTSGERIAKEDIIINGEAIDY